MDLRVKFFFTIFSCFFYKNTTFYFRYISLYKKDLCLICIFLYNNIINQILFYKYNLIYFSKKHINNYKNTYYKFTIQRIYTHCYHVINTLYTN